MKNNNIKKIYYSLLSFSIFFLILFIHISPLWAYQYRIKLEKQVLKYLPLNMLSVENVKFNGSHGAILDGTFFAPENYKDIVLILHGLGARKVNYYPIALELVRNGFAVFIYSFRAHGNSSGNYDLNYMVDDVVKALDFLEKKYGKRIYVIGGSTGAMVGYIAASKDKRIKKIVVIAAPISFNDIVRRDRVYRNLAKFQHPKILLPDFLTNLIMKILIDSINNYENIYRRKKYLDEHLILSFNVNSNGFFATKYGDLKIARGTNFIRNSLIGPSMKNYKIKIPSLFIVGNGDSIAGTDKKNGLIKYKRLFPNSRFIVVPAIHRKSAYLTKKVKKEVIEFLKK